MMVNADGYHALYLAVTMGGTDAVAELLSLPNAEAQALSIEFGRTIPLYWAARFWHLEVVEQLLGLQWISKPPVKIPGIC